ncbi:hypothetical protein GGS23DRAFT_569472 [Durotheca rogersii]|uniref:uncharacterized protein n=1 Tax=Durotheca rogersii TaxID=419775 RepID=UPI002220B983|nr:uncharacterized protein GGS23DRAFT_569472 [Durotheca rogersii]KAI5862793.1 hypothetical protein GGS23DRAFT_569472 [Durotheca rogersii]
MAQFRLVFLYLPLSHQTEATHMYRFIYLDIYRYYLYTCNAHIYMCIHTCIHNYLGRWAPTSIHTYLLSMHIHRYLLHTAYTTHTDTRPK